MRAMVMEHFGEPEVLHWGDLPKPVAGPGEVLVRVHYAGVNPADWKTREGLLAKYISYTFPFVLGFDLAGVVEAIGPGVTSLEVGDRVFGTSRQGEGINGSYAEYCLAYATMVVKVPASIGLAQAAGLATAGTTAYGGLLDVGALEAGQTVLVNGGAGGVGSLAIQIARARGARVAATCSAGNADYVRGLGAELAIDYGSAIVAHEAKIWATDGVDLVLDAVGLGSLLDQANTVVKPGGTYVEIETLISEASDVQREDAARGGIRLVSNMIAINRLPQHLKGLAELVAAGTVAPPPTEVMPLSEVADAHRRVKEGHVRGKIVLAVGGD